MLLVSYINNTGPTEETPVQQFQRQFTLKLMTEDCKLLEVHVLHNKSLILKFD